MTIDELYNLLGKERDLNFEMSRKVKGADKKYYLGLSTAYDTARGWVFQMIGEEGVEAFKEALRAEAYNRLVKPKKKKAVPTGDVMPWSVKRKIMESENKNNMAGGSWDYNYVIIEDDESEGEQ